METTAPKVRYLPPPVRMEIGGWCAPARPWITLVGLWCAGAMAVLCNLPWQLEAWGVALAALFLSALAVYGEVCPRDTMVLDWSAQGWRCFLVQDAMNPPPNVCTPTVVLDFQRVLLVRVRDPARSVHWLWCVQHDAKQWHRFRCALFAARQP